MTTDPTPCNKCRGDRVITVKCRDLAGKQGHGFPIEAIAPCDQCGAKGFLTREDRAANHATW